jgi:hypothetical protein
MKNRPPDELEFDVVADAVEALATKFGNPIEDGKGDFTIVHDYYVATEVRVVFAEPIFCEALLNAIIKLLTTTHPDWSVFATFMDGAEWRGMDRIVITRGGWEEAPE